MYKSIELFAGCGGMALGLEMANIDNQLLVEINKDACETLKLNRPNWNVLNQDIKKIDFTEWKDKIDIVTGGFPCQPFSNAGKHLGLKDTKGTLFYELARCIKEVQPKIFLAENVKGLLSNDNGRTITIILDVFKSLGYNIKYKVLNAVNFNVAQSRERLFIIGVREDLNIDDVCFPLESKKKLILKDILSDLVEENKVCAPMSSRLRELVTYIPPNGDIRNLPDSIIEKYKINKYSSLGKKKIINKYKRLCFTKPSNTLLTTVTGHLSAKIHPSEDRYLSVRECARVQSFPDEWKFSGSPNSQYRQIGNAVAVNMAYHLGKALIATLEKNTKDKNMTLAANVHHIQYSLFDLL